MDASKASKAEKLVNRLGEKFTRNKIDHRVIGRCVIVLEPIPIMTLVDAGNMDKKQLFIINAGLSSNVRGVFVFGTNEDTEALKRNREFLALCEERWAAHVNHKFEDDHAWESKISQKARDWLIHGEHGSSSWAIFSMLPSGAGLAVRNSIDAPRDIADFRRCKLLSEAFQDEFNAARELLADMSEDWAYVMDRWDFYASNIDRIEQSSLSDEEKNEEMRVIGVEFRSGLRSNSQSRRMAP